MKTRISRIAAVSSICALSGIGFVLAGASAQAAPSRDSREQASVAKADVRAPGGKSQSTEAKPARHEDSSKSKTSSKNCHDDSDADDVPVVVVG